HMTALYSALGEDKAEAYLRKLAELGRSGALNVSNGNSNVARLAGDGAIVFGWTDTDDYAVTLERGAHVAAVFPDQEGCGPLLTPNTIVLVKDARHAEAGKRFIDWVLRPETEKELAFSRSAQIPVRAEVPRPPTMLDPARIHVMQVDFRKVGAELE